MNQVITRREGFAAANLDSARPLRYDEEYPIGYLEGLKNGSMYGFRKPAPQTEEDHRSGQRHRPHDRRGCPLRGRARADQRRKSALHKAGQLILEGHIRHCVLEGLQNGDVDETIAKFTKTIDRFANMS